MSLQNLLAIQRLQAFEATPGGVQRLLASAARNLTDARLTNLSADNRFDAAYKTIMQCAMARYGPTATAPSPASPATTRLRCRPCRKPWASPRIA